MNIAVSVARPLEETPGLSSTQEQERMVHTRREYNRITVTSSVICVVCIVGFVLAPLLFDAINISQLDYDSASVKIIKDKPSIIETYHQLRTNDVNRSRVGENPDSNSVCDPRNFLVLIKSGSISQYQNRRTIWRKSSCPTTYTRYGLKYHFMLGMPSHAIIDPNSHNQAKRATDEERKDMSYLQAESNKHKDMIFLSLRDVYEDFAFKTLRILEWAAERGMSNTTSVVVLQDDEYCLQPEILERICVQHSSRSTSAASRRSILYTGVYFWDKAYSDIQKGLDGKYALFFQIKSFVFQKESSIHV